eukprot:scaffold15304_cov104-Isochrysis_galbana.AAC.2
MHLGQLRVLARAALAFLEGSARHGSVQRQQVAGVRADAGGRVDPLGCGHACGAGRGRAGVGEGAARSAARALVVHLRRRGAGHLLVGSAL